MGVDEEGDEVVDGLPDIGFGLPVSGSWATRDTVLRVASRAEELGYASLWSFQRLLVPVGSGLGPQYRSVLDPVVPLALAAAVTERVRLGTAIVNAPFTPPVTLAKQLTTLDVLSGGRLDAGLGAGWEEEEFVASGVDPAARGPRLEEYLAVLHAVWGPDPVGHDGRFYSVPASSVQPKPVQRPHPPLLLGGGAEAALRRAGRLAEGWISASRHDLSTIGAAAATVRAGAAEAGRDPDAVRVVVRGLVDLHDRALPQASRALLTGSREQVLDDLRWLAAEGATEVFLDLNFSPRVGSPDADPADSLPYAERVLEAFAPGGS